MNHVIDDQTQTIINALKTLPAGDPMTTVFFCQDWDDETGNDWYVCQFCEGVGIFPNGNGGIGHSNECALVLAQRIISLEQNPFDQLAYKSILHQLAHLTRFPEKRDDQTFRTFCPFCQCWGINHTETCIIVLAKQQLSSNRSETRQ